MTGGQAPEERAFVQVHGEPEQRGQVTRVTRATPGAPGMRVTVRFDMPVDWERISQQGRLEVTPSSVVYGKQREAVAALRTGRARNQALLPVLVDHRVVRIQPVAAQPAEHLDDDQLTAFRKALGVEDILLVLGPPGTGKTRVISQTARSCALDGGRVLVTSLSNRAVDNVLGRLPPDLLAIRVGNDGRPPRRAGRICSNSRSLSCVRGSSTSPDVPWRHTNALTSRSAGPGSLITGTTRCASRSAPSRMPRPG
jgi:AAA domain